MGKCREYVLLLGFPLKKWGKGGCSYLYYPIDYSLRFGKGINRRRLKIVY